MLLNIVKWFAISATLIAIASLCWFLLNLLPPQHNPFRPLAIEDPIGVATHQKLNAFDRRPDACFDFLDDSEIDYVQLPDSEPGEACGFFDALTLERSLIPYSTPLQMTCTQASAVAVWERQSLMLQAKSYLESPPAQVLSYGSFSCRRVYGRQTGRYSQHATGNAIDIRGVELKDGTIITVKEHWGENTPEGRFLEALRDDACRIFGTVLGPEYNAAHADHFHLDMNQTGICR